MLIDFRYQAIFVALFLSKKALAFLPTAPTTTHASVLRLSHQQQREDSSSLSSATRLSLSSSSSSSSATDNLEAIKSDLVRLCRNDPKPSREEVRILVDELEILAEQVGIGQASSISGLMAGEWELLYSPEDITRSSPFFWAFRKAFPEQSDQIFGITDSIPAPIKEVGPAYQEIDLPEGANIGKFISRVKVATLGGLATSIMTTRGSIIGLEGVDGLRLKVETTKPEDSTVIKTILPGPLGQAVSENSPPFPSGEALERVQPGSSEVLLRTTFCDEGLRISRNGERLNDIYVWKRRKFASYDFV